MKKLFLNFLLPFALYTLGILKAQEPDPIKILLEIQQKMAECEELLSRSAAGVSSGVSKINEVQEAIKRRIEKLTEQGMGEEEIAEELGKFINRKKKQLESTGEKLTETVNKIEEALYGDKALEKINKVIKEQEKLENSLKGLDDLFKKVDGSHNEALKKIEQLIEMAKDSDQKTQQNMPEGEEAKPTPKPGGEEEKPTGQEDKAQKSGDEQQQGSASGKENIDKTKRNEAKDSDNWGNLPSKYREHFNGLDTLPMPDRYKYRIQEYIKKLNAINK